jgi:hypothetical protein
MIEMYHRHAMVFNNPRRFWRSGIIRRGANSMFDRRMRHERAEKLSFKM